MDSILIPETSMDISDSPLAFDDTRPICVDGDENHDKENDFVIPSVPDQVPKDLSDEEQKIAQQVFGQGQLYVQYTKIHCTSCNIHLGSAPGKQNLRYVHPLLNVLICKSCYDFYTSGEFEKDEDGSELYCRWCGQGGRVICCSKCSYVFCSKCIRQNIGKRKLAEIKLLDDWLCFVCDSKQIARLKILCHQLYEFTKNELEIAKSLNDSTSLNRDYSLCCSEKGVDKRKLTKPDVNKDEPKPKRANLNNNNSKKDCLFLSEEKDEVVCTPDLSSLMHFNSPEGLRNVQQDHSYHNSNGSAENYLVLSNGVTLPFKPRQSLATSSADSGILESMLTQSQAIVPPLAPLTPDASQGRPKAITLQPLSKKVVLNPQANRPILPKRDDWFIKVKKEVISAYNKLSNELTTLSKKKLQASSVTDMTAIHNSLQELLSTSINNFYSIRKNLKTNFLWDMQHTQTGSGAKRFVFINKAASNSSQSNPIRLATLKTPVPKNHVKNPLFKPRLKVKSVAELSSVPTDCIVIPDDPEPEDKSKNKNNEPIEIDDALPSQPIEQEKSEVNNPNPDTQETNITSNSDINPVNSNEDDNAAKANKGPEEESIDLFDPSTVRLIKYAILESKIDQLLQSKINYSHLNITSDKYKKMISVRVMLQSNYARGTLRTHPKKFYKPMALKKYKTVTFEDVHITHNRSSTTDAKTIETNKKNGNKKRKKVSIEEVNEDPNIENNENSTLGTKELENITDVSKEEAIKEKIDVSNEEMLSESVDETSDQVENSIDFENDLPTSAIEINPNRKSDDEDKQKDDNDMHPDQSAEEILATDDKSKTTEIENDEEPPENQNSKETENEDVIQRDTDEQTDPRIVSSSNIDEHLEDVNDEDISQSEDIEDFLGGSILVKNSNATKNYIETILNKYGITNEPTIVPDVNTGTSNEDTINENKI